MIARTFSDDIAIDLGTANTLVYVVGRGIIIDEPSMVAVRLDAGKREIVAVGQRAMSLMQSRTKGIDAIRPMRDGVIADFVATETMLRQFIRQAKSMLGFRRPRILICVPAGATPVERRAVYETALSAGARRVHLIEEPVAAAIGAGLSIDDPAATMVVDIGGGTTDIAMLLLGDVLQARSLRVAGNAMDQAIVRHVRRRHNLAIGLASAEQIKIEAGSAMVASGADGEVRLRGRDLRHGESKTVVINSDEIAQALSDTIGEIAEFIQRAIEDLSVEYRADIIDRGINLSGGGARLHKLDAELSRRLGLPFTIPDEPTQCVVRGTAKVLETLSERQHLLIEA